MSSEAPRSLLDMASSKISNNLIDQILDLNANGKTNKEIAEPVHLKRLQVAAILAHVRLQNEGRPEPSPSQIETDLPREVEFAPTAEGAALIAAVPEDFAESEAEDGVYVGDDAGYGDLAYWVLWNPQLSQKPAPHDHGRERFWQDLRHTVSGSRVGPGRHPIPHLRLRARV